MPVIISKNIFTVIEKIRMTTFSPIMPVVVIAQFCHVRIHLGIKVKIAVVGKRQENEFSKIILVRHNPTLYAQNTD